jgi:arginase
MALASTRPSVRNTTQERRIALIAAPSNLGLMPQPGESEPGARKAPDVLQSLGISERLRAESSWRVSAPPYNPEVDAATGVRNAPALRRYSEMLADSVGAELTAGRFPLVIGGDCSILLGPALALRRRGRYGLIFFDGHTDFKLPATSPSKGAAGMDLAFVTGHGPAPLAEFGEHTPLFQEADTIAFGYRDLRDPATYTSNAIFETQVRRMELAEVRRRGVGNARAPPSMRSADLEPRAYSSISTWMYLTARSCLPSTRQNPEASCPQKRSRRYAHGAPTRA